MTPVGSPRNMHKLPARLIVGTLFLHACLLVWNGWRPSPTLMEPELMAAGVSHLQFSRFDLCRVTPPLVRCIVAAPVILCSPKTDWSHYDSNPLQRPDALVSFDFLDANGSRFFWLLTLARW